MKIDAAAAGTSGLPGRATATDAPPGFQDEFLRLLVAQLSHQNPLEPQDGAEFVAQLAQFANVEQGAAANKLLSEIRAEQSAAAGASLAGFVGTTGAARADMIHWDPSEGEAPDLYVDLPDGANAITVTIHDDAGNVVRTMDLGSAQAGEIPIEWDGTDNKGVAVGEGSYTIEVTATDADDAAVDSAPMVRGVIDAVEFADGFHMLRIGAISIAPASIVSIGK